MSELSVASWNIGIHQQAKRAGAIAQQIAKNKPQVGILIEVSNETALKKALNDAIGTNYILETVSHRNQYQDGIGLLVVGGTCQVIEAPQAIGPVGTEIPYFLRTELATPIGRVALAGMHADWSPLNFQQRKEQYQTAIEVTGGDATNALVAGDFNTFRPIHEWQFRKAGFKRLTPYRKTWPDGDLQSVDPDYLGLTNTLVKLHLGFGLDAIYGKGDFVTGHKQRVFTGVSDHAYIATNLSKAS